MSARPANRTRQTVDLVAKFRREGKWHLIPIYHLLQLSDFGREGIANSGSYRFADHLYQGRPSGRGWIGRLIDRVLLNFPAARGMRARCAQATLEMKKQLAQKNSGSPFRVLSVPCGIPRDMVNLIQDSGPAKIEYTGMDIDPVVLDAAREFLQGTRLRDFTLLQGNALEASAWPAGGFDFISSTGLGEFLGDRELELFYENARAALAPGGVFFTSLTAREPRADWLLRAFELRANYRSRSDAEVIFRRQPWSSLSFNHDATGLQTFVRVVK